MCPKQEPRVDPGECTVVGVGWAGVGWGVWIVPESTLLSKSSDMACTRQPDAGPAQTASGLQTGTGTSQTLVGSTVGSASSQQRSHI